MVSDQGLRVHNFPGGCSETFSFLYADDSIQVNSETGNEISILIIYEVNNKKHWKNLYRRCNENLFQINDQIESLEVSLFL